MGNLKLVDNMERQVVNFPDPEKPFESKKLIDLPEPFKSRYEEKLKEIGGAAIIDDTAYTNNKQREWLICEQPVYLCMKMKEELGRGVDPQPKAMKTPLYAAELIVVDGKIYKNMLEHEEKQD